LKPDDAVGHYSLGLALTAKGDRDGAIAAYRTALRLEPHDADTHYYLGDVLRAKGLKKEAALQFREFLRLAPDTPNNRVFIQKARAWLRDLE
ncbi:MAG: tetratricopeptide repeat protein, partial [Terriglobia bacterium]